MKYSSINLLVIWGIWNWPLWISLSVLSGPCMFWSQCVLVTKRSPFGWVPSCFIILDFFVLFELALLAQPVVVIVLVILVNRIPGLAIASESCCKLWSFKNPWPKRRDGMTCPPARLSKPRWSNDKATDQWEMKSARVSMCKMKVHSLRPAMRRDVLVGESKCWVCPNHSNYMDRLKTDRSEDRKSLCLVESEKFLCNMNV